MATSRRPVSLTIDLEGPFFRADVKKTVRQNIRDAMDEVAKAGEREVKARLTAGGREGFHTIPFVRGRTVSVRPPGRRWATHARISVMTDGMERAEAIRTLAIAAGRHNPFPYGTTKGAEGRTHAFARTKAMLRQLIVRAAGDLAKGLN